ncbi:Sodium/hydrogen exchanger 2 [Linum perenne]
MGFSLNSALLGGTLGEPDAAPVRAITLFVVLLLACIIIGHLLEKSRWMNESITALVIGVTTGILILATTEGKSSRILTFDEDLFFIYALPPIIFNAGFQVKKKQFFRNFMTITLFGAVGTLISFVIISYGSKKLFNLLGFDLWDTKDYLALGAIFSATDSVCTLQVLSQEDTPLLYSLVFGEGVVNDATSVVLFNAIQRFDLSHMTTSIAFQLLGSFLYLFFTSTLLGVVVGLLSAYIIKKLYFGRHSTDREVALMMLMAYLSYVMAELFSLSGILTVFFCGIVMSHYTWHNVTESSRVTTKHAFATLSFISEIFIFLYVGMDALDIEKWRIIGTSPGTSAGVSSVLLGMVLLGRAASVFPLSFVSNLTKKNNSEKIRFKEQLIIWWAGLIRGAVSMALAYNQFTMAGYTQLQGNAFMITSTITIVLFSTVIESSSDLEDEENDKALSLPLLGGRQDPTAETSADNIHRPMSLRMLLTKPTNTVHHYWRKFDDSFMRPMFGGRGFTPFVPGSPIDRSLHGGKGEMTIANLAMRNEANPNKWWLNDSNLASTRSPWLQYSLGGTHTQTYASLAICELL